MKMTIRQKRTQDTEYILYEGEKYSDLCINCILPVRRWTPEENPDYRP